MRSNGTRWIQLVIFPDGTRKDIPVKVLAKGAISKPLTVHAHKFSGKAAEKIAAAGGTVEAIA